MTDPEILKWSTGLFAFTSHPGGTAESANLFFTTCFCPCVIFGYNAEMLRDRISALHDAEEDIDVFVEDVPCNGNKLYAGLVCPLLCIYHTKLRNVTRRVYGINPNMGLDCMTTLCCSPCAIQQERREIIIRNSQRALKRAGGQALPSGSRFSPSTEGGQLGPGGSAPVYNYELPFDEMTIAGTDIKIYSENQQMRLNIDAFGNGPWNNAKLAPRSKKMALKPLPVSQQVYLGSDFAGSHWKLTVPAEHEPGQKLLIQDFTKSYTYDFAPYIEIEPPPDCFPGKDFTTIIPY